MFDFEGKLVLVTGSTKGIGLACAEKFALFKADVIINGRSRSDIETAIEKLKTIGPGTFYAAPFDLGNKAGCDACLKFIEEDLKRPIDVLINNLGIFEVKKFEEITDEDWFRFFEVNVMSAVRLCRSIFPQMLQRGSGSIVFISSEASTAVKPFMIHYSMTKTAQLSISRALAELCKGHPDVRVNSIMPGPTHTEGVDEYIEKYFLPTWTGDHELTLEQARVEYIKKVEPDSLIQRLIEPEEVANTVVFLASNKHAINGASIRSEGGILKHI